MTKRSLSARAYADRVPRIAVGPLRLVVLAECAEWLSAQGYSPGSAAAVVNLLKRLSGWMGVVGATVDDIGEGLVARFVAAECARDVVCSTLRSSMGAMRRFLTEAGYLPAGGGCAGRVTPARAEVERWGSWLRIECGLCAKTIAARRRFAAGLLDVITRADGSVDWGGVDTAVANTYITREGRPYGVVTRAHIIDAVRCLLRWALAHGPDRYGPERRDPQARQQ